MILTKPPKQEGKEMKALFLILVVMIFIFAACTSKEQISDSHYWIPTEEHIQKIFDAAPDKPSVEPKKERTVLVFSISWGYKHKVIPYGKKAFELIGSKSGAYKAVVSDDASLFEPENLNEFDAVVFNNTNNEIFLPENFDSLSIKEKEKAVKYDALLKKSFVEFLKSGKGLVVMHAGVASFRKWEEFGEIIGARFDNHPWNSGSTVTLKVDEPDHPIVNTFEGKPFAVTDEIYQVKAPYSRESLRVLLTIDTTQTDMTVKNIHRTDGDFAMSWIKNYGKGRVFYNALGHERHIFWDAVILQHLLDGIQFVTGDLECDTTPSSLSDNK
jgi:type 1 glutamine amidotransferase